jgi:nucleotide-binding universal stress UspA family protein
VNEAKFMFKHLLVPFDGSPLAEGVLHHTTVFARVFEAQVTLLCMLAYPHPGSLVDAFDWQLRKAETEAYLDSVMIHFQTAGVTSRVVKMAGQSARSVINYIHHHQVDLVVLSSHDQHGWIGKELGGILHNLLQGSRIVTLRVRAGQPVPTEQTKPPYQRLLMPLAESPRAADVLPFVTNLALIYGTRLLLVHVLCRPQIARHTPPLTQARTSAEQVLARKYEAVASHFDQLERPSADVTEKRLLESEEMAACLHELAKAEAVDLVILRAHCYTAGSQWPNDRIINFIAYGTTPLLVVQVRSVDGTPTLATGPMRETGGLCN